MPSGKPPAAEGEGGFQLTQQVDHLFTHQRQVDQHAPFGLSVVGPHRRLQERAPGDAQTHHGHAETRAVDHLHHAVESPQIRGVAASVAPLGPQGVAEGVVELDLTGGDAAGAQLELEPPFGEPVGRAVLQVAGNQVQADARRPLRTPFGTSQQYDGLAVDVGAEPLLAADEDPAVADVSGHAVNGAAQVRAAISFCEEHRTVGTVVEVVAAKAGQHVVAHVFGGVGIDQTGHAAGHTQGAHHSGVGLGQQVIGPGVEHPRGALAVGGFIGGETRHVPGGPQLPLGVDGGTGVVDLADLVSPAAVADQLGRVGVDDVGVAGDVATAQVTEVAQLGVDPRVADRRAVGLDPVDEHGIEVVPVVADGSVEGLVVDHGTSSSAAAELPAESDT